MVDIVEQPVPVMPTNVQSQNPYNGLDRGLFLFRDQSASYGRIHAAAVISHGPAAGVSVMKYQVMKYAKKPVTAQDFAAGTLLTAPDGTQWFDCLARGLVLEPISAEYWAMSSYLSWYVTGGANLTAVEIDRAVLQAKGFVKTMGQFVGLNAVELTVAFGTSAGQPLSRTGANLSIDYVRNNVEKHVDETVVPDQMFDPVRAAMTLIKTLP